MKHQWPTKGFRPPKELVLLALAALLTTINLLVVGVPFDPIAALLTDTQPSGSNAFTTKPDWEAPTTSASKLLNSIGYGDYLKQGGTYQVCASVTDNGNPPSGISTVTANLAVASNVITTGATAVSLSGGAYTCDGVSYNFQSASRTADASIPEGSRSYQVTATDVATYSATTGWNVTIDNTSPSPTALATANGGATAGKMEAGDYFTVTVSEGTIDLNRIISGWNGSSTAVQVKTFNDDAQFGGNDGLAVCNGGTGPTCRSDGIGALNIFGRANLGATTYVTNNATFDATLAWNSVTRVFTVTLGACTAQCTKVTTGGSSTATLLPQNGATQAGGVRDKASNGVTGTATEVAVHF